MQTLPRRSPSLHASATRGGEKTVQIGRSLVGKPLTEIRHRCARADAGRLVPRLPCFLCPSKLAQDTGSIRHPTGPLESLPLSTPKKLPALEKRPAQAGVGPRIPGIELERLGEEPPRLGTASARRMLSFVMAPKHKVVGLEHTRWRPADTNLLSLGDLDGKGSDDLLCDLILQGEEVAHFTIVALGPDVIPRSRVHQLSGDPHSMTRTLHAAFQDIPHTEVTPHLAYVHRFALVR